MVMALTMVMAKLDHQKKSPLPMVRVVFVLIASVLAGFFVSSDFMDSVYNYNDTLCNAVAALAYSLVAILSIAVTTTAKKLERYLCCILASCMLISSMFNVIMINHTMYYLLVDIKQNNAVSWKNIYFSIELAIGFIVGINGLHYIASRCINFCNRFCAIVRNNSIYHERDN
mgnify:FL=1